MDGLSCWLRRIKEEDPSNQNCTDYLCCSCWINTTIITTTKRGIVRFDLSFFRQYGFHFLSIFHSLTFSLASDRVYHSFRLVCNAFGIFPKTAASSTLLLVRVFLLVLLSLRFVFFLVSRPSGFFPGFYYLPLIAVAVVAPTSVVIRCYY